MRYYLDTNMLIFMLSGDIDNIEIKVREILYELSEGHKDVNDHVIIAQAISDKIPLISSDIEFENYVPQGLNFVFNKR